MVRRAPPDARSGTDRVVPTPYQIDFLGIGAQKCGTTWIYEHLAAHPQIRFPAGKEVHFWDREWSTENRADGWLQLFPPADPFVKQGEITPAYGFIGRDRIEEVHAIAPDLRLFYSVRNPIARAWSAAMMMLERAEMVIDEASDQWFLDHFHSRGSLQRGRYDICVENWLSVFPRESLQIIVFDDITTHPRQVLSGLAGHLGLDTKYYDNVASTEISSPIFEGRGAPIRPQLIPPLRSLYAESVDRLSVIIGRDLTGWLDWDGRA